MANPDDKVRAAAVKASKALARLADEMEAAKFPLPEQKAIVAYSRGIFQMSLNPRGYPSWRSEVRRHAA